MEIENLIDDYKENLDDSKETFFNSIKKLMVESKGEMYITLTLPLLIECFAFYLSYLLSIYYIEVWELDDFTAGICVSLGTLQVLHIFLLG